MIAVIVFCSEASSTLTDIDMTDGSVIIPASLTS